jgi:hypothetical protein
VNPYAASARQKKAHKFPKGRYVVAALAAYNRRNKVLRGLGFASYEEYLASPLWAEISRRKLDSEGRRCFACGRPAAQVHHGNYAENTLRGPGPVLEVEGDWRWRLWLESVELYAVCATDHEWAEYYLGAKLPPDVATKRLKNRRRKNRLDETVPRAARQGRQERKAREMEGELARLLERDEEDGEPGR